MFQHSLSRQLFIFIAGLCLLTVTVAALMILPTVETRIRSLDQQLNQAKISQTNLTLHLSHQFSQALDDQVLRFHRAELENFLKAELRFVQTIKSSNTRASFIDKVRERLSGYPEQSETHFWLADDRGNMLYHPQGDEVMSSPHHQLNFSHFANSVRAQGSAAAQLPWRESYIVDTKPVVAVHIPEFALMIGADVSITQLSSPPIESYQKIREIMQEVLNQAAFGNHGQMFIFFPDNDYLVSGLRYDLDKVLAQKINSNTGNLFADDFRLAAKNNLPLKILWNRGDDPNNFSYPASAHVSHIADREVYLVSITYPDDLNQQATDLRQSIVIALVAVLTMSLAAAWWLSRHIVRPIQTLEESARKVGTGEFTYMDKLSDHFLRKDELGSLAHSIEIMVQKLQDTIAGLDQTVETRTSELHQQNQQLNRSLADQGTLLKEVHHRVKNNLSVIIGFIQLQQRRLKTNPEMSNLLIDLRSRIYTIELLHNLLHQTDNYSDIHCQDYYQALVKEIWQLHNPKDSIQYHLDINVEQQPIEQLICCGQIINELLSNTLKYAFEDKEQGTITMTIGQRKGTIEIQFSDDGCGFGEHQTLPSNGLGLTLLQHLVENKLQGNISWVSSSQGLSWILRFPA